MSALPRIAIMWWLTHAIGIVVLTPVGLAAGRHWPPAVPRGALEWGAALLGVTLSAWLPFSVPESALGSRLFFLPFPFLLWAAIRLGIGGAAVGALLTSLCALAAAVRHTGPLAVGTPNDTLTLTWLFVNVVVIATLISAALVAKLEGARLLHADGEARLRAVLDSTGEGIVVTDGARTITHVNRSVADIWPASLAAPRLGSPADDAMAPLLARVASPGGESVALTDRGGSRAGTATLDDGSVWEVQVHPLDERPPAAIRSTAVTHPVAGPVGSGAIWTLRDVTARVRAEEERQQLQAQLLHGQKLESLGVMAGGIAHDFNNLLMAIRARAELIDDLDQLDTEVREDVEAILRIVDQAAALCRQMLVYAGRGAIEQRTLDLSAIAGDIPEFLRVSVSRRAQLALDLSEERLWVSGDPTQLRQVALNLASNASDAIDASGRGGTVRVTTRCAILDRETITHAAVGRDAPAGEYCILQVEDDGVGMSAEVLQQVFDPFFSSKGTGRGLGLSSVLGVVRRHRGVLMVESTPGRGSRFVVALPPAPAPHPATERTSSRDDGRDLAGRTILVVDDDDEVRDAVARLLQRHGLAVRHARDGVEALAQLQGEDGASIELVLLDLTMPRLSGPATLRAMRDRSIAVPVIVASGYSAESIPEPERGGRFVQKPYHAEELRQAIAEALGQR
jgi:signal transduction histidine kinase/PAS domain-containing protein